MIYISGYNDINKLGNLGFVKPKEGSEDADITVELDEFIGKIASLLLSLLEGYDVEETLKRMAGGLAFEDLRNRMLNVFGKFI
jgi:hypothetical protein